MSIIIVNIDISNVKSHVKFFKRDLKREEIHLWVESHLIRMLKSSCETQVRIQRWIQHVIHTWIYFERFGKGWYGQA